MGDYRHIALKDMIEEIGETKVREVLSNFSCPRNKDVEYFLRHRAIQFSKSAVAPSHLVFCDLGDNEKLILCGYFTITRKTFTIPKNCFSKTLQRKFGEFGTGQAIDGSYEVPAPLIAQLGKNYTDGADLLIRGADLMQIALDQIAVLQKIEGGRITYVECEDKPKLIEFYNSHGFFEFNRRLLDFDEKKNLEGKELIQLLRYKK